ncbi:transport permease protein [Nocardiopsis terrae]|uniref:Transport permease protein n=1 Tax=Nocardiopsis terrae TaxID=372655 RepID=A0ABR9HH23_9ACTN|nr:ABC transporter permease [Nocardiopsis terrae]MBE1458323.1 ABC transporter DrrB family efflux protein [Nocardiopsis terrae]GHC81136.1 transport permease protein [Nocardiopsis terrae]
MTRVLGAPDGEQSADALGGEPRGPRVWAARAGWAVADSAVVARRYLAHLVYKPDEVVGTLMIPVLAVLLFGFVFGEAMGAAMGVGGEDYRDFLMPGLFALTMAFGIGNTTIAVVTDVGRGVVDRFRTLPMAPSALLVGRSMADVVSAVVDLLVLVGMGLLIGWQWHHGPWAALAGLGLLLLLRLAFTWIGIYLGLLVRSPEAAMKFFSLVFPLAMVAETFVPTEVIPGWLAPVAEWNPLSATVLACRELFGNTTVVGESWVAQNALLMAVVWPLVLMVVFVPLAVRRYRRLSR